MRVTINFNGVIDHLDVLSEQMQKSNQLKAVVKQMSNEISLENTDLIPRVQRIENSVNSLQRNIENRRKLLVEIVSVLKNEKCRTEETIVEMEYKINNLSSGDHYG